MRVLFLTGEFPPLQGGVGDCTNEIALALAQRGVPVTVLTTDTQSSVSSLRSSTLTVLRAIPKWDWSALAVIRQTITAARPNILHIQYQTGAFGMHPMINFAPRLLRSLLAGGGEGGVKSVVTFHDLRPMYLFPKAGQLRDWVTFQLARASDAVIATNQEDYAALAAQPLRHLTLIPIASNIAPVPPPAFDRAALRRKLGVQPDETLLCYFGFLNDSKGGETLIRALAELPNAKLLMLGGQTGASDPTNLAYLARVRETLDALHLTPRVIWTDFMPQPEITAHFLASDICILPYRDGASFRRGTLMAALAHDMAIITTTPQVSPAPAGTLDPFPLPALCDGENVLLVPPDNPRALADAANRIAASPALRARLQQGARDTAQFFTWDKIADAHLALYHHLLRESAKNGS